MNEPVATAGSPSKELLAKVSRYEALFELTGLVNAAADIESVSELLARRIKYIADVYSWRYVCVDGDPEEAGGIWLALWSMPFEAGWSLTVPSP
jgi:hypothetical protein